MVEELREKAKELLKNKQVDLVIGYKRAADGVSAMPAFIYNEKETDLLIWDAYCIYNLVNYLNPVRNMLSEGGNKISNGVKDFPAKKKGIVAKPCDVKSIIVLLQENQLKREEVFIIGVECQGVVDEKRLYYAEDSAEQISFDERCKRCKPSVPALYDILISQKAKEKKPQDTEEDHYESIKKFEAKSIQERFKFWQEEFSRCIRCYACRQICPMCYCPRCVADQMSPSWFSKSGGFEGNFSWNLTRAIHLAGRCIDCGECERACPVGIPLRDINKKIEKDIKELFNYEAGSNIEQKPLLSSFDKNDTGDWIK